MTAGETIVVREATADDAVHAEAISAAIRIEVEAGAIGMALRTPELLRETMHEGDALIALRGGDWVGFCYVSPWQEGRFVSTSALIVPPEHRGLGIARLLKRASLELAQRRYPAARPFGLTTSPAVAKVNVELGFREVPYAEITNDAAFWKGCESCPHHADLLANRGTTCHCRAFVR